jgi:hypothetical protein
MKAAGSACVASLQAEELPPVLLPWIGEDETEVRQMKA